MRLYQFAVEKLLSEADVEMIAHGREFWIQGAAEKTAPRRGF